MKHIFYLHSNICVISSYDTINRLVEEGEQVVVVSERKTRFPLYEGKIATFDIEVIIDKYRKETTNPISTFINYRFGLFPRYKEFAKEVIADEDFALYIPSYCMYTIMPFLNSKHCKGYYFIEEGTMSYLSAESLRKRFLKRRYRSGRILLDLTGMKEHQDYYVTDKFMGCIALSEESFPWCTDKKIVVGMNGYYSNIKQEVVDIDHLIITDYLRDEKDVIEEGFRTVIDGIFDKETNAKIGIKFHPTAFAYERVKIDAIIIDIKEKYKDVDFKILPSAYSIEALMYKKRISLYSVFNISSLLLYAIVLKSDATMLSNNGGEIGVIKIPTIRNFIDMANTL